jgi:CPA1 family monovalent cation:H+ antiporter
MILNIIAILSILFISIKLEKNYKLPSPLVVFLLTLFVSSFFSDFLSFTTFELFAEEMLSFVVLLVLVDAFILKWKDLQKNWLSLIYLSVISVILSIVSGILLTNTLFSEYNLSIGSIIVLFAMVLATDPVAVVSTFKQYPKLPHKVKFLAEGESLFNDAIALIAFLAFGIYLLQGNLVTLEYTIGISIKMIGLSIAIGLIIGFLGLLLMKTTKDVMGELVLILLIAYSSFEIAELFHVSGLLAEIVAILFLTTTIEYSYRENIIENEKIKENKSPIYDLTSKYTIKKLFSNISNIKRQDNILSFLTVIALFVNAILFMSLAKIIDFGNILHFWKETIAIFIMTTLIRMIMMAKFAFFSSKTNKMERIDLKSYFILVFAGIKGGLSIVMLNMLNHFIPDFKHFDMFVAIVSGVILLSMFIYVLGLFLTISFNKREFELEYDNEQLNH